MMQRYPSTSLTVDPDGASKPVLLSYCDAFVKSEALHVYRQVTGVTQFENWVVTRHRVNEAQFPYERLVRLRRSPFHPLRRAWFRAHRRRPTLDGIEVRRLQRIADRLKATVVHVYFGNDATRLLPYLRQELRPKVVSFHGMDLSSNVSDKEMDELIRHVDIFLGRSQSLLDALRERGCPGDRVRLNLTGVPIAEHFVPREIVRARPLRLLQACRFIRKKGLDVTLRATALLRDRGLDVELDLAGDGGARAGLERLAADLGLARRVRFLGFLPNDRLLQSLGGYDVFLHPSRTTTSGDREGIPNAMLEAMAAGVPVAATRHSGIPEAVSDGVEGLLVPEDAPEDLADAVQTLIDDPDRYRAMSEAAHERIRSQFSSAACVKSLESSYRFAIEVATRR